MACQSGRAGKHERVNSARGKSPAAPAGGGGQQAQAGSGGGWVLLVGMLGHTRTSEAPRQRG